jgi:hypothetical protein
MLPSSDAVTAKSWPRTTACEEGQDSVNEGEWRSNGSAGGGVTLIAFECEG